MPATPSAPTRELPELLVLLEPDALREGLLHDARVGLTAASRTLPPKYFYDDAGSELFEDITRLPEYYQTRAERALLAAHADDIAAASGAEALVELGSGSSEKTGLLLGALAAAGTLADYVAVDVSPGALHGALELLARERPAVRVTGVVADFERHLRQLPAPGRRLVAFLGGTLGNLDPAQRARFLTDLAGGLTSGESVLLGVDLVKDPARLVAAYDDAAGVTAAFNRNVLRVLDRQLGADFDPDDFDHVAVWDAEAEWIEMRLRARRDLRVRVPDLDLDLAFAEGEEMRTEISAKFRREGICAELVAAGLEPAGWWTDGDFALVLALRP
ncbi:L-histidine N(alpha)-methyltransferase [Nocardioides sp. TRM66260-LWL]|uniref:L-histidine N(alpha)-methyltransferase n=1 Tax=Nocardioides sp. TRM66260-LWL TaxID=2874478 RepID=UPI001CC58EE9|nr:L-histidine N(alpha)-methyltransferase [Nocardioides sp. TRM66260-LWL]MBZ5735938.1 L-histidine N(alpha)-methyltransferase [Nocardioides sp. TRM66260-LWL]